jgi:hypothetical protein
MRLSIVSWFVAAAWLAGCNAILGIGDVKSSSGGGADAPPSACTPSESRACYSGSSGTEGVGPCHGGTQVCSAAGQWGACEGQVVPQAEKCGNGIDDNCSGQADEDIDLDHDGFTTCAGDCCDSTECANPAVVNPGAFEVPGNGVDDDCNGMTDEAIATCDTGIASDSADPLAFARAMDLCSSANAGNRKWGVLSAAWTLSDGTGAPDARGHSIRPDWGPNVMPHAGASLGVIATGIAADEDDTNPTYSNTATSGGTDRGQMAPFPTDWIAANGGHPPVPPGCPLAAGTAAHDPVMLTLAIRVPTNARSFSFDLDFYTAEFPEYVCSQFNDYMVVLLDSTFNGAPANPLDKNLAAYQNAQLGRWPVGVNLANLDKGLFTQCVNGAMSCSGSMPKNITTCAGTSELAGTGLETPAAGMCDAEALVGGASGWLVARGNVAGGETITLRIAIWDTSDGILDSTALVDNFRWSTDPAMPGAFAN